MLSSLFAIFALISFSKAQNDPCSSQYWSCGGQEATFQVPRDDILTLFGANRIVLKADFENDNVKTLNVKCGKTKITLDTLGGINVEVINLSLFSGIRMEKMATLLAVNPNLKRLTIEDSVIEDFSQLQVRKMSTTFY